MTVTEFEDFCRRQCNAVNDTFYSSPEIYGYITAAANEILSIIGLVEGTDTSQSTVIGTQAYSFPTNFVSIRALLYGGEKLSPIAFEEWENEKSNGSTVTGRSYSFVPWNRQVLLVPVPSEVKVLTFYGLKGQAAITASGDTIVIPEILQYRMTNRVIEKMFDKDKNAVSQGMAQKYHNIWTTEDMPAFRIYNQMQRKQHRARRIKDADTYSSTGYGVR